MERLKQMRSLFCVPIVLLVACAQPAAPVEVETSEAGLASTPWSLNPPGNGLWAVAIDGDRAALTSDETVRIYERVWFFGWFWIQVASIPEPQTRVAGIEDFGSQLDLWGDRLILKITNPNSGSRVQIYERQTNGSWTIQATFGPGTGTNINEWASYGSSPKLEGDFAVWGQSYASAKRGRVYVARRGSSGNWSEVQTIDGPGPNSHQYFGTDLVLQNGLLAVGAPGFYEPGHVYVYSNFPTGVFVLEADHADPTQTNNGQFGQRIGFDNTNLVVRSNAAHYVYRRTLQYVPWWAPFPTPVWNTPTTWNITASGELSTYFSRTAIAVNGNVEIYDMTIGQPTLAATLFAPAGSTDFGKYVDLHDDRLIVGAGTYSGPADAYVY